MTLDQMGPLNVPFKELNIEAIELIINKNNDVGREFNFCVDLNSIFLSKIRSICLASTKCIKPRVHLEVPVFIYRINIWH